MSPLWRLVLQWWCGGRATAVIQAVEEVVSVQGLPGASSSTLAQRILERPSTAGQAAQMAAAGAELAARRAEV